jgi:hypothetical protein
MAFWIPRVKVLPAANQYDRFRIYHSVLRNPNRPALTDCILSASSALGANFANLETYQNRNQCTYGRQNIEEGRGGVNGSLDHIDGFRLSDRHCSWLHHAES